MPRFETTGKTGHDLQLTPEDARFTVAKLQGGYTRYLPPRRGFAPGLGAAIPRSEVAPPQAAVKEAAAAASEEDDEPEADDDDDAEVEVDEEPDEE